MNPRTPGILSRIILATNSAFTAVRDPSRQDMVAVLSETTGLYAARKLRDSMLLDPTGRRILRERPLVSTTTLDIERLRQLPNDTFGAAYVGFLHKWGIRYVGDQELAYVLLRYRQVHDFWHVILGIPVTLPAEIALKWFEFFQTGLPSTLLSALVGPVKLSADEQEELLNIYAPWAVQCSMNSVTMMNVFYEDLFHHKLTDVQKLLRITPAPNSQPQTVISSTEE